ncbi:MAG TPA: hypothetical protein VFK05_15290 [Polyangiaceae bacterium]|nr:hypothetical protein [Polyangiaceae bacterium]
MNLRLFFGVALLTITTRALLGCAGKALQEPNAYGAGGAGGGTDHGGQPSAGYGGVSNSGVNDAGAGYGGVSNGGVSNGGAGYGGAGYGGMGDGGEAGSGVIGDGGVGGDAANEASLTPSAWDVILTANFTQGSDPAPAPFAASLYLGNVSRLSRDGKQSLFSLTQKSGLSASVITPPSGLRFSLVDRLPETALVFRELSLRAFDDDQDGVLDRLEGSGSGQLEVSCGDCYYSKAVSVNVSGKPDQTPPGLRVPKNLAPIERLTITPTEAVHGSLTLTGSSVLPLDIDADSELFSLTVLPFSGKWKLSGVAQDFAELALDLSTAELTTMTDPGTFAQDGFETQPNATLAGASWIDVDSGLPIPSGGRALFLPPGSSAILHLKRTGAETKVTARVVDLSQASTIGAFLDFQAAVIGSTQRSQHVQVGETGTLATTHAIWTTASPPHSVEMTLMGDGSDVALRVAADACVGGPCLSPGALIVDDLKLE